MEKELYQVTDEWNDKSFPINWNKLPEDLIYKLSSQYLYNVLSYNDTGEISLKTVVYFKKVAKIPKSYTQIETENIIFGI